MKNDMDYSPKIYIAGHNGMVGSAIIRQLNASGQKNILVSDRSKLDLIDKKSVNNFFHYEKPEQVYIAAAKVGGIYANNTYPADFIYENLMIQLNIIDAAFKSGVKRLLFLGSSCIYPRLASQPIEESALLTGLLEPTNEPYGIAKIAGIKLCESYNRQFGKSHGLDFRSVMPTNLYGINDNYHSENSHVIPALIRRFHEAKLKNLPKVHVWGTGSPKREFLFVDDMAKACIHIMNLPTETYKRHTKPNCSHVNVGSGIDLTIKDLAYAIKKIVGFSGEVVFDSSKPDGTPRKLLDSSVIRRLGWRPNVDIITGLTQTYKDYKSFKYQEGTG